MPKINFKKWETARQKPDGLPSELDIIISMYGLYLDVTQAAECLNCKYCTVRELILSGRLKASRNAKNAPYRISAVDLVRYIKSTQIKGDEPA